MENQLVWLKRDLRIRDHRPLTEACARGPVIVLYVYEPEVYGAEDFDPAHQVFINESLAELEVELRERGGTLIYRHGEITAVLDALLDATPFARIWSHEETGNAITYARDIRVASWARARGITWTEIPQFGVFRPIGDRDGWAKRWDDRMLEDVTPPPQRIASVEGIAPEGMRSPEELGIGATTRLEVQRGGESHAWQTLESFLTVRGVNYRADMSSPVEGWTGCSRLSPYLTFGAISMRETFQETRQAVRELRVRDREVGDIDKRWFKSLSSFEGRLHWHCHFMQKLEDEPEIEFRAMSPAFEHIRDDDWNDDYFEAWCAGQTGYPMVDACMRCLHQTGWLNFRMRAMIVSFASYHLWLDWRPTSRYLAREFLDYEPGIHYAQFQMQSGVTGINSIRIYSPIKQVADQDPDGVFIRRWVPELAQVPSVYLAEPHKMPPVTQLEVGCVIGKDYPEPIVEHRVAYKRAKDRIWAVRKSPEAKEEARRVYEKHGSRRRPERR